MVTSNGTAEEEVYSSSSLFDADHSVPQNHCNNKEENKQYHDKKQHNYY